jgi:hypothetical protein
MSGTIDVHDLTEEQVEALEALADFYRRRRENKKPKRNKAKKGEKSAEGCPLAIWDSDVIGRPTREELYEDR